MNIKEVIIFLCLAILVIGGCGSVNTQPSLSPTHYTVSVMLVELSKNTGTPLGAVSQSQLEDMIKRRNTNAIRLPTIHILPGETKQVENGKTHSFPINFGTDGEPTQYRTVRDGLIMQAMLYLMQDKRPKLTIAVEESHITKWSTGPTGLRFPKCKVTDFSTTIYGKWGQWQNVGKAMATKAAKGQVILVRIDKPT
jgi:hypothetical protein